MDTMFRDGDTTPSEGRWVHSTTTGAVLLMQGQEQQPGSLYGDEPGSVIREAVRGWVDEGHLPLPGGTDADRP